MSIASMTGFARTNGNLSFAEHNISWTWEIKSVNGKSLDLKYRLPPSFEDIGIRLKPLANQFLQRGSISAFLEISFEKCNKKIKINDELLAELIAKSVAICDSSSGKISYPSSAEILNLKGVIELEENPIAEEDLDSLKQQLLTSFSECCQSLQSNRRAEGEKIKQALLSILVSIENTTSQIEQISHTLPQKLKEKLTAQISQYSEDINISEERLAQEVVLLITRADIKEEIDRLKTHIKSAREYLNSTDAIGRRLDFLCQELNREANTTCSKACDIAITNFGMELKAQIEQFREQVQNIE